MNNIERFKIIDKLNYFDILILKAIINTSIKGYSTSKEVVKNMKITLESIGINRSYSRVYFHKRLDFLNSIQLIKIDRSTSKLIMLNPVKKNAIINFLSWYQEIITGDIDE